MCQTKATASFAAQPPTAADAFTVPPANIATAKGAGVSGAVPRLVEAVASIVRMASTRNN